MIYHIDLLLDEERRTATFLPVRALVRLASIFVFGSLLVATFLLFLASRQAQNQVADARTDWQDLKPKHEALLHLRGSLVDMRSAMRQLQSCNHARLAWGDELACVQRTVPLDVQLTALRVSQFVGGTTSTACAVRSYDLHLIGKTSGEDADAHVRVMLDRLASPAFSNRIELVTVPNGGFRQDPGRGALRTDRVFDVLCRYRPRSFE